MSNMKWIVYIVGVFYIVLVPFTKVEESFNLQAIHDILFHSTDLASYDHHEFPGVVPRTFLGAIAVAVVIAPLRLVDALLGSVLKRIAYQYIARFVLLNFVLHSMFRLSNALERRFDEVVAHSFLAITSFQFHILFYASRTLPNTFALVLTTHALASWFDGQYHAVIALLAIASTVFRCDIAVFAVPLVLSLIVRRKVGFLWASFLTIIYASLALAVTVPIDSIYWGRLLWPEGVVLWFNTAQNKSSEWGVSPFHWYFTVALPKALHFTGFLVPLGLYFNRSLMEFFMVLAAYLSLYSFLPHKELRFIFPAIPLLNSISAVGLVEALKSAQKRVRYAKYTSFILIAMSSLSLGVTYFLLVLAVANYPGGHAFRVLADQEPGTVHMDVYSCMTGVSRFGEEGGKWIYSKEEGKVDVESFDYLLASGDVLVNEVFKKSIEDGCMPFSVIHRESGFSGINLKGLQIKYDNVVYVLKRNMSCISEIGARAAIF